MLENSVYTRVTVLPSLVLLINVTRLLGCFNRDLASTGLIVLLSSAGEMWGLGVTRLVETEILVRETCISYNRIVSDGYPEYS